MKTKYIFLFLLSIFLFSGCNGSELFKQSFQKTAPKVDTEDLGPSFAPVSQAEIEPFGTILTTKQNLALYTYSNDSAFQSNCYDSCAIAWPPLLVEFEEDVGGMYGVTERKTGELQVTYNGKPLYTYTPDSPNKVTGDGKDGVWSVIILK